MIIRWHLGAGFTAAAIFAVAVGIVGRPPQRVAAPARIPPAPSPGPERRAPSRAPIEPRTAGEPPHAMQLALAEGQRALRAERLLAALRDWASVDVEAAGEWALAQSDLDHGLAFAAIFRAACSDPERAIRFARAIAVSDPVRVGSYGNYLISALGAVGEHRRAAEFAAAGSALVSVDWLTNAYKAWSRHDPETAVLSAVTVAEGARRRAAFEAAIAGWARSDPVALADCALGFAPGPERKLALTLAVHAWATHDRVAATGWLARCGPAVGLTEAEINRALEN